MCFWPCLPVITPCGLAVACQPRLTHSGHVGHSMWVATGWQRSTILWECSAGSFECWQAPMLRAWPQLAGLSCTAWGAPAIQLQHSKPYAPSNRVPPEPHSPMQTLQQHVSCGIVALSYVDTFQLASEGRRTHRACGLWDRTMPYGLAQRVHLSPWALLVKLLLTCPCM